VSAGLDSKVVIVTRATRLQELVSRFHTSAQARFYVEHLGADFTDYLKEDETYRAALSQLHASVAELARVQVVDRGFLPNFLFAPDDTIVTLGQDGLVANTLKYLSGQPVIGVNPDPARWDGPLLPFTVGEIPRLLPEVMARKRSTKSVTMAMASLNNGQTMYAVNDLFIGPRSHGSARYVIEVGGESEVHSSSGVIVSTGLGSTGWMKSLLTGAAAIQRLSAPPPLPDNAPLFTRKKGRSRQISRFKIPSPPTGFAWDATRLMFTVREPFPTNTTGASLVFGAVTEQSPLVMVSQMAEHGVIFSDGIEYDFLEFNSGTRAVITVADRHGVLVA
jgi:NAD kinase